MPSNYKAKVEMIKTIQNYLASLMQTIPDFVGVYKKMDDLTNCLDTPTCYVIYNDGENLDVREKANAEIHFDLVIKNAMENELDNLDLASKVADKFEDYRLVGNCIGLTPGFPKTYYDSIGDTKTVLTVITLDIEI